MGIAHGQQAQHKGVDKAEYRGIGADSEAEREQRDGGNPGVRRMRKAKGTSCAEVASAVRAVMCAPGVAQPAFVIALVN